MMSWVKFVVFCCLLAIVVGDIHRIILKPERHRSRNKKRDSVLRGSSKHHHHKQPAFYNSMEDLQLHASQDYHNYFQNSYNQPNWNTNEPYFHKYNFNSFSNNYPNEMFKAVTENTRTIADIIDITTSVPERTPINTGDIDFRYFQNIQNPLHHNINDEQIQPIRTNLKPKRKRNKPAYEVFENVADAGDHRTNYQTIDSNNKDFSSYYSEINDEKSTYIPSNYGKRKKIRRNYNLS